MMFMDPEPSIKRGHRFRGAQPGLFGRAGIEWIVHATFLGTEGHWHARAALASDSTLSTNMPIGRYRLIRGRKTS